jgi:hypothetical protein
MERTKHGHDATEARTFAGFNVVTDWKRTQIVRGRRQGADICDRDTDWD